MGREKIYNKHHIIGRSQQEWFNVHDPRNITKMEEVQHNALHSLFRSLLTPKDQLLMLADLYEPVMSKQACRLIDTLVTMTDEEFYDRGIVKTS